MRSTIFLLGLSFAACAPSKSEPVAPVMASTGDENRGPERVSTVTAAVATTTAAAALSADVSLLTPVPACTKMGCMDQLTVEFSPLLPKAGTYVVTLTASGKSATCEMVFPHPGTAESVKCTGKLQVGSVDNRSALPFLRLVDVPEELEVVVKLGRSTLVDSTFRPTLREFRPNGPNCEPVCVAGTLGIELGDGAQP